MATMNISILTPRIELISEVSDISNSCRIIYYFKIKSTVGANFTIDINRLNNSENDLDKLVVSNAENSLEVKEFPYNDTLTNGEASVKLAIGNVQSDVRCNEVEVIVTDTTNNVTETRVFSRCIKGQRC